MSEKRSDFKGSLREVVEKARRRQAAQLAATALDQSQERASAEVRRATRELQRREISRIIRSDVRDFADIMQEYGQEPDYYRLVHRSTDLGLRRRLLRSNRPSQPSEPVPVWVLSSHERGGYSEAGSRGQFGSYRFAYRYRYTGVAINTEGELLCFTQEHTKPDVLTESHPRDDTIPNLQPTLDAVGIATDADLVPFGMIDFADNAPEDQWLIVKVRSNLHFLATGEQQNLNPIIWRPE